MLYLDSVTHDPPGTKLVQGYVNYAWEHLRLSDDVFVFGSPATAQLLVQAAIAQDYALLSTPRHHLLLNPASRGETVKSRRLGEEGQFE